MMSRLLFVLALFFAIQVQAQKNLLPIDVVSFCGLPASTAKKQLEDFGFTQVNGGPQILEWNEGKSIQFANMEVLQIIQLCIINDRVVQVFWSYTGKTIDALVRLSLMSEGFEKGQQDDSDEGAQAIMKKYGSNIDYYYRKGQGKEYRLFIGTSGEGDPEYRAYLFRAIEVGSFNGNEAKQTGPASPKKHLGPKSIITSSGLEYLVLRSGSGSRPSPEHTVVVNYKGMLANGKVFDERKGAETVVKFFLPGFAEALQLMQPGSKLKVYIPAHLHLGEREQPGLPANSDVIYEIELVSIKK